MDGDTGVALATGHKELGAARALDLARLGTLAADCLTRAVGRAIHEAAALGGATAFREL